MKKRVFIYIRVSTREQAEEGYSLGEQEERLKKYCDAMEWELVEIFRDGGFSGSNLERPAMTSMIKKIEKHQTDIVLVDKLDRLSRSQFDTLFLIQKVFNANNVAFVSRAEAFDTSTSFGRAMVGILAVFAELEREKIRERSIDGIEGRAKEGKFKGGGQVPIGYNYIIGSGILTINEYEAMQVREVFDLFIKRTPVKTIARTLNEKGYRTKYGDWKDMTIRRMIVNRNYIGKIKYKDKWYDGLQDAIISDDVFEKAQQIQEERNRTNDKYKVGKKYKSPLGGLIWCSHCGARYQWRHNGKNKDGTFRSYYICYSRAKGDKKMIKDPNCKNKTYRDFALEEIIFNEVRKLKTDTEYFSNIKDSVDTSANQELIQNRIEQIDNQLSKLMDLYSIDGIDIETVKNKITPLTLEKNSLVLELDDLQFESEMISQDEVMELVDLFNAAVTEDDKYKVNRVLTELIDHIEIDGEDIRIHWNFKA